MRTLLAATLALLFTLPTLAQETPLRYAYAEAWGNAGALYDYGASLNYDSRFPTQWGYRVGVAADIEGGTRENDFSLLALGHYFIGEGPLVFELGAGPLVTLGAVPVLGATSSVGVRLDSIADRFITRLAVTPTWVDGELTGSVGFSFGLLVN